MLAELIAYCILLICGALCIKGVNDIKAKQMYEKGYNDYPLKIPIFVTGVFISDSVYESYLKGWNKAKMEHDIEVVTNEENN